MLYLYAFNYVFMMVERVGYGGLVALRNIVSYELELVSCDLFLVAKTYG